MMPAAPGKETALVAVSGGMDSAVAVGILLERGYYVEALYLRLMNDEYADASCSSARALSKYLGIRLHERDCSSLFRDNIIKYFVDSYSRGLTPNPCVRCNPLVKVAAGLEVMKRLGMSWLATGHYARITKDGCRYMLRRGCDANKDQSYFLHGLNMDLLQYLLFPLGGMLRTEVVHRSRMLGVAPLVQPESQDVCFAGRDYRRFLQEHGLIHQGPGEIVTLSGEKVGMHSGLHNYTVGQRRGLGLPGPEPSYVIRIDMDSNRITAGPEDALYSRKVDVANVNWLLHDRVPCGELRCSVKIRYRHRPADARLFVHQDHVIVEFDEPQRAITPGQSVVFYDEDTVIGGGEICA